MPVDSIQNAESMFQVYEGETLVSNHSHWHTAHDAAYNRAEQCGCETTIQKSMMIRVNYSEPKRTHGYITWKPEPNATGYVIRHFHDDVVVDIGVTEPWHVIRLKPGAHGFQVATEQGRLISDFSERLDVEIK